MLACALLVAGLLCTGLAAFLMGRYSSDKKRVEYQTSMWTVVSGVMLFFASLYTFLTYD